MNFFGKWYSKLRMLLNTAPLVMFMFKMLRDIIEQFEVPGNGEMKKEKVLEALEQMYTKLANQYDLDFLDWSVIKGFIDPIIDLIIEVLNMSLWSDENDNQSK